MADPSSSNRAPEAWLRSLRPRVQATLNVAIGLGLASAVLLVAQAWVIAHLVNAGVMLRAPMRALWPWVSVLPPLYVLRFALVRASERVAFEAGARLRAQLRNELMTHLQRLGTTWLQGQARGDLVNSVVGGIEALESYYARYLPSIALTALAPLVILAAVVPTDSVSALVLIITAPLIPLFMWLIGRGAEDLNQQQWGRLAFLSARFLDTLQGLTTLKLLGASRREADVVARLSEDYRVSTMKVLRVAFLSSVVLEFLATVSIAVVAVLIGFRLLWGRMDFLPGFFVLLLAPEYYAPLRGMGTIYHLRMEAIGAAERIVDILGVATPPVKPGRVAIAPGAHPIAFDDVHVTWPDGTKALAGCTFTAPAGRVTAIIGSSGAGKSTVLASLMGFVRPTQGCVRVSGIDVCEIDATAWLAQLAWVPQRPHLFADTVAANIRLARPDASDTQVRAAAEAAQATAFIDALPDGDLTLLGERGAGLSGGQAQRIALARAFLRDAPVLLLDEATASLDAASQDAVMQALGRLAAGRTVLMVTHRLQTLHLADHLVVLDHGRVVESGSPDALAHAGGPFARMIDAGGMR